jgi:hypothetical protein
VGWTTERRDHLKINCLGSLRNFVCDFIPISESYQRLVNGSGRFSGVQKCAKPGGNSGKFERVWKDFTTGYRRGGLAMREWRGRRSSPVAIHRSRRRRHHFRGKRVRKGKGGHAPLFPFFRELGVASGFPLRKGVTASEGSYSAASSERHGGGRRVYFALQRVNHGRAS